LYVVRRSWRLGFQGSDGRQHGVRLSNAPCVYEIVQLSEDQSVHLACLGAGGLFATSHALDAPIALDRHHPSRHSSALRMECHRVERAYHGAHRTGDALLRVDQNEILLPVAIDGARWAHLLARRRIAVSALARKRRELNSAGRNMDPRPRWGLLEERRHRISTPRMLNRTSELALSTPYATLGIYEDGFHLRLQSPITDAA
jgi:hypothetical protein